MMNELERFERLAARARAEPVPSLDVAGRVLRAVRRLERPAPGSWTLPVFTGLSALAATVVAVLALQAWEVLSDPLAGILHSLTLVIQ